MREQRYLYTPSFQGLDPSGLPCVDRAGPGGQREASGRTMPVVVLEVRPALRERSAERTRAGPWQCLCSALPLHLMCPHTSYGVEICSLPNISHLTFISSSQHSESFFLSFFLFWWAEKVGTLVLPEIYPASFLDGFFPLLILHCEWTAFSLIWCCLYYVP